METVTTTTVTTRLFSSIGIETSSLCNRHCVFCPNNKFDRPDQFMSIEMFEKILEDLRSLKYKRRVELYIYNEPTRDPRLKDLIALVREKLPRSCIMINTNGDFFRTPQDIAEYFFAGLNQMQINVYSAADGQKGEKFERGIKTALKRWEQLQNMVDSISWIDQDENLYQYIGPDKAACKVIKKFGWLPLEGVNHFSNRSGNLDIFPETPEPLKKMCTRPFRFLNIDWKGNAILCCNDYHSKTTFGNVQNRTIEDLWNDIIFHTYRIKLQNKKRDIFLCDVCDFDGGFYQHNIQRVSLGEGLDQRIIETDLCSQESIKELIDAHRH